METVGRGTLGEPVCSECRDERIDTVVATATVSGSLIVVDSTVKACTSCGYRRPVHVTTVNGGAPEWDKLCELCQVQEAAAAHERAARQLRRRAAAILSRRRADLGAKMRRERRKAES